MCQSYTLKDYQCSKGHTDRYVDLSGDCGDKRCLYSETYVGHRGPARAEDKSILSFALQRLKDNARRVSIGTCSLCVVSRDPERHCEYSDVSCTPYSSTSSSTASEQSDSDLSRWDI